MQEDRLRAIAELGEIMVGHRDDAAPFSYCDDRQQPVGYAMDLCGTVVDAVKQKLGKPDLKVVYMPVSGTTRIPLLVNGTIDMECGTTTNNIERQNQVTFSNIYFVAGLRILSKKTAPLDDLAQAKDKTVVALAGTTSIKIINAQNNGQGLTILQAKDLAEGMLTLATGRAEALIFDDVSIAGAAATSKTPDACQISPTAMSVEPYGVMLRRDDDAFKALVDQTLAGLYASGEIDGIYRNGSPPPSRRATSL